MENVNLNNFKYPSNRHVSRQNYKSEFPNLINIENDLEYVKNNQYANKIKKNLTRGFREKLDDTILENYEKEFLNVRGYKNFINDFECTLFENPMTTGALTSLPCLIKSYYGHDLPGITKSYLYAGEKFNSTPIYMDYNYFYSIYFNAGPAPKIWYVIPRSQRLILNKSLDNIYIDHKDNCSNYIQHRYIFPTKSHLKKII